MPTQTKSSKKNVSAPNPKTDKSSKKTASVPAATPAAKPATATAAAPATAPAAPAALPPPNAALLAYVQQATAAIASTEAGLTASPPALTAAQKRHSGKLRAGGDKAVAQIGTLAQQYGIESTVLQVAPMLLALSDAQALAPLITKLQAFVKHAADLVFLWESAAWTDAMQFYALLQRRALVDGSLATSLAPVAAFFAKRHDSTKVGSTPKNTAKANAKAVARLKKSAPQLLASSATDGGGTAGAAPASTPSPAAATTSGTATHS